MNLSKVNREFLINLVKALLPRPNKIPSSYYSLVKSIQKEKFVSKYVLNAIQNLTKNAKMWIVEILKR